MKLVANWPASWRWVSMQVGAFQMATQGSIATGLALMPEATRNAFLAAHAMQYVYFTIAVTFVQTFSRLVQQQPLPPPEPKP
jgi:hypothetical protein